MADRDQVRVRNPIGGGDLLVSDKPTELVDGDVVQGVVGLDGVGRDVGGGAVAVGAVAGDGDEDGFIGGDGVGRGGGEGEGVGADKGKESGLEERLESGERGFIVGDVADERGAGGGCGGVADERGEGGGGEEEEMEEEMDGEEGRRHCFVWMI